MGIQARFPRISRAHRSALLVSCVFLAGITAGLWVSLRFFNEPIAENEFPRPRMPGRFERFVDVPRWLDHPFTRADSSYLTDYRYRGRPFDLNRLFFGEALAAVPPGPSALATAYETQKARGLLDADEERVFHQRFDLESRAVFGRVGKLQGDRALAQAQIGLADERANLSEESLRSLRVPGMVLYLAASAAAGRSVRARIAPGTVLRTQTISRDDYRVQIDHEVLDLGLAIGSAYDSVGSRRSLSLTQSLGRQWAVGVDRTLSNIEEQRSDAVRVLFSAPF